ncbi:hypothetical protein DFJ73DRAFT_964981 [Zopfochytrium polystomum]|nr:hypothetical protein DFJ73DRAFT_964981 [Zopfochytrium polystomum]
MAAKAGNAGGGAASLDGPLAQPPLSSSSPSPAPSSPPPSPPRSIARNGPRATAAAPPGAPAAAAPVPTPAGSPCTASWDPAVLALLQGVYLSRTSALRPLRRDRDAARAVVAAFARARASHFIWTPQQRGCWPAVARVDFPPPLLLQMKPAVAVQSAASSSSGGGGGERRRRPWWRRSSWRNDTKRTEGGARPPPPEPPQPPPGVLYEIDYRAFWDADYHDAQIRRTMGAAWDALEAWAVGAGLHALPPSSPSSPSSPSAGDADHGEIPLSTLQRRQRLLHSLRELIEPFHVNMLPIVLGDARTLPRKCRRYATLVERCLAHCVDEAGKVGYLTVHEGFVDASGEPQRRPGAHVEAPGGYFYFDGDDGGDDADADAARVDGWLEQMVHQWGWGYGPEVWRIEGGVFQASSVADTCRVWDCVVRDHAAIVGPHGSVEHLRAVLDRGPPRTPKAAAAPSDGDDDGDGGGLVDARTVRVVKTWRSGRPHSETRRPLPPSHAGAGGMLLAANAIAWMTDRTPHESVPVVAGEGVGGRVFRQYFRLVTSRVTAWYEAHSTRNDECGVAPPAGVRVVKEDKFVGSGMAAVGPGFAPLRSL